MSFLKEKSCDSVSVILRNPTIFFKAHSEFRYIVGDYHGIKALPKMNNFAKAR